MADLLKLYEDTRLRQTPDVRESVILYTRVYNIPKDKWASVVTFTKGSVLEPEGITGPSVGGVAVPVADGGGVRVFNLQRKQQPVGADDQLVVVYYTIRPYAE